MEKRGCRALLIVVSVFMLPALAPADVETIFVVPGSHFDVGFDDLPSRVREDRVRAIDAAIKAAGEDPAFHWTEDAGWGFGLWLERHRADASALKNARRLLQNGQLTVSAVWVNPHAAAFWEFLGLLTAHLDELANVLDYRPAVAVLNDSPSYPEAIVDALAARGVRYVLVGPNMGFTKPLPEQLVRSPFWWESARGARVLVYIDPDGYFGVAAKWGLDPDGARYLYPEIFPRGQKPLETMEKGMRRMLDQTPARYDAVIVQHACDDCGVEYAVRLTGFIKKWNQENRRPVVVSASPADYFRHIEALYGPELPVRRGEWGGQWDHLRAACPVWTWRLREAMRAIGPDSSVETKLALATAMDHGLGLGPGWEGKFTRERTIEHAAEQATIFSRAVEMASGKAGLNALPPIPAPPPVSPLPPVWLDILSDPAEVRLRTGLNLIEPFVGNDAPVLDSPLKIAADGERLLARTTIDRRTIAGSERMNVAVVMEFPLRAAANKLAIAPEGSPAALAGLWLRGEPPPTIVAPEGLRVAGLAHPVRIQSPVASGYTLVPDGQRPGITWLQVLLIRQSRRCELKGQKTIVLPYEVLYPGEPAILEVGVEVEILNRQRERRGFFSPADPISKKPAPQRGRKGSSADSRPLWGR